MKGLAPVNRLLLVTAGPLLLVASSACSTVPAGQASAVDPHVLYVYEDGSMMLNDRSVDPDDVVIYPDGFGGERAALKMRVPLHPDYYRDTIIVERASGPDNDWID